MWGLNMHKIINFDTGEEIGITDFLHYIRLGKNGCFVMCKDGEEPQGIAYNSTPYNLAGKESMGDLPTVMVREYDAGKEFEALNEASQTLTDQLTEAQLALCDVYELALASVPEGTSELAEGQTYPMDAIYANLIRKGKKTIDDVPERNKANVEALLAGDSNENPS